MSRLNDALDERFDDIEEVKDVYNHGCGGGVSGFIYYSETRAFFFEHEDEIEEKMDQIYGTDYIKDISNDVHSVNQLINKIVWMIVEDHCHLKLNEAEESAAA